MRSSLCATRSIAAISRRYHTVPVNEGSLPPPRNNNYVVHTLGWLISSRMKLGNRFPLNSFSYFSSFSSFLFFRSIVSCSFFFFFQFSFLGRSSLDLVEKFVFFSWNFLLYSFSLFSSPSRRIRGRLICIHEKSAAVSRVKIYLSVAGDDDCV